MRKKLVSLIVCAVMLLQLAPALSIGAAASGSSVTYNRWTPECAILNAVNGKSTDYYNDYVMSGGQYNAVGLFGDLKQNSVLNSYNNYTWDWTNVGTNACTGSRFSVMSYVALGNASFTANCSATFNNKEHKHSVSWLKDQKVVSYSGLYFYGGNTLLQSLWGSSLLGTADSGRLGDPATNWVNLNLGGRSTCGNLRLTSLEPDVLYNKDKSTCTCHSGTVTGIAVAFRDETNPTVLRAEADKTAVKPGDTVSVTLTFGEPIRFADDSADHGDAYINLKLSGWTSTVKAYLTKLDGLKATFSYTVPASYNSAEDTIVGTDLSPLMGTYTLRQIGAGGSFDIDGSKYSGEGYTTAPSLITDLAGNPIKQTAGPDLVHSVRVDGVAPTVKEVSTSASTNNADVKAALGKSGLSPTASDYADASDKYLGAGDTLTFTVTFSEQMKDMDGAYTAAAAATNLKDKNGAAVTVQSVRAATVESKVTGTKYTTLTFAPITITGDMSCDSNLIAVTGLTFSGGAADLCGNAYDQSAQLTGVNKNPTSLDVEGPIVSTQLTLTSGKYTPADESSGTAEGFCFPFSIVSDDSGFEGLSGSFVLRNNEAGGADYAFQYAVTNDQAVPTVWTDGRTGAGCAFQQLGRGVLQYIHIRLLANEKYDLTDVSLVLQPADYAGNVGSTAFPLNWAKDGSAPTAAAGQTTRTQDGTNGTLTVTINASDKTELKSVQYLWNDGAAPDSAAVWQNAVGTVSGKTAAVTASGTAATGTKFEKTLWVRASDTSGNVSEPINLGVFSYDLQAASYSLTPSADYQNAALSVAALGDDDALLFLLHIPGDTDGYYYIRYVTKSVTLTRNGISNIFEKQHSDNTNVNILAWKYAQITQSATGQYTVTAKTPQTTTITDGFNSILGGGYYGNLDVKVIAGKKAAFTAADANDSGEQYVTGIDSGYTLDTSTTTLRVGSKTASGVYSASCASASTDKYLAYSNSQLTFTPGTDSSYLLSSLAGVQVNVQLSNAKVSDWGVGEIDFAQSWLGVCDSAGTLVSQVSLQPTADQTVLLPELDANGAAVEYPTGVYTLKLHLVRRSVDSSVYEEIVCKDSSGSVLTFYVDAAKAANGQLVGAYVEEGSDMEAYLDQSKTWYNADAGGAALYFPASTGTQKLSFKLNLAAGETTDLQNFDATNVTGKYYGQRAVRVWNVTAGVPSAAAQWKLIETGNTGDFAGTNANYTVTLADSAAAVTAAAGTICLVKDTDNLIAVQTMNDNGLASNVQYYKVHPVTAQLTGGSFSTDAEGTNLYVGAGNLIYTPASGQDMTGCRLYCCDYLKNTRTELMPRLDGSYACPLPNDDLPGATGYTGNYYLCAQDAYGNYTLFGEMRQLGVNRFVDAAAPVITALPASVDATYGSEYTAVFTISDQMFANSGLASGMKVNIGFDDAYTKLLGLQAGSTFTATAYDGSDYDIGLAGGSNAFGITGVSATIDQAQRTATVTVRGVAAYDPNNTAGSYSLTISLTAADCFGNAANYSNDNQTVDANGTASTAANTAVPASESVTVQNLMPQATGSAVGSDHKLTVSFNQPVVAEASWKNAGNTYPSETQEDAFPVTGDGAHGITFYDVFGRLWTQDITVSGFGACGFDLSVLPAGNTKGPVTITALVPATDDDSQLAIYGDFGQTKLSGPAANVGCSAAENGFYFIYHYADAAAAAAGTWDDRTIVNITNIVSAAPAATLYYRFEASGQVYRYDAATSTGDTLPASTEGNVTVWYTTDRNVTATNDAAHTFTQAGSYTFTYADDFGNTGSVTADLSGVSFGGGYKSTDTTPPQLAVGIDAKRGGAYSAADSFGVSGSAVNGGSTTNTLAAALTNAGPVQAYSFAVTATDESPCSLVLKKASDASGAAYGGASDSISGVTLSGKNVLVSAEAADTFTVAAVDSSGNRSWFTITPDMLRFDSAAPTVTVRYAYKSLYDCFAFLTIADVDDKGAAAAGAELTAPSLAKWTAADTTAAAGTLKDEYGSAFDAAACEGSYYYEFRRSESITVCVTDAAGNTASRLIGVTGLDSTKPTLSVEWSPCNGTDSALPPVGPYHTDVTALVSCSKPISSVSAQYKTWDGSAWSSAWSASAPAVGAPGITIDSTNNSHVIVGFPSDGVKVLLTATAANGKTASIELTLADGVIVTDALTVTSAVTYQYRTRDDGTNYSVPCYAVVTLTPGSAACRTDAGNDKTLYSAQAPLKLNVYANGTYSYRFSDKAGNAGEAEVTVSGLDRTAPTITTDPSDTSALPSSSSVKVRVTLDEKGTISNDGTEYPAAKNTAVELTFTKDGNYTITAADDAGNTSYAHVVIGNIDGEAPSIVFNPLTIVLKQDSDSAALTSALGSGWTVSDNKSAASAITVSYSASGVVLSAAGTYQVPYTVTDAAGNVTNAVRYVRVYDKNLPDVAVNGTRVEMDGLTVLPLSAGYAIKISNLQMLAAGEMETCRVYLRSGIWSSGQMKGCTNVIETDHGGNGSLALAGAGYYTLYIVTQSRSTYRALLYVEG